jgi:hypothetical protein
MEALCGGGISLGLEGWVRLEGRVGEKQVDIAQKQVFNTSLFLKSGTSCS